MEEIFSMLLENFELPFTYLTKEKEDFENMIPYTKEAELSFHLLSACDPSVI